MLTEKIDLNARLDEYLATRLDLEHCKKIIAFYAGQRDYYKLQAVFQLNSSESAMFLSAIFRKYHANSEDLNMVDIIKLLGIISTIIRPANKESGSSKMLIENHEFDLAMYKNCIIGKDNCFHSILVKFTSDTELQLIFQEQLMNLLAYLFKINLGEADLLRRDFEKRKFDKIESKKEQLYYLWRDKAVKIVGEEVYDLSFNQLWEYLISVTGYSFNKSHSISYSAITLLTTAMNLFDSAKSFASAININIDKTEKIRMIISDLSFFGVNIVLPSVNNSFDKARAIDDHTIVLPINIVKGIGATTAKMLCNRKFESINDFFNYASTKSSINKQVVKILIEIDYFRDFNLNREQVYDYFSNFTIKDTKNVQMTYFKTLNGKKYNSYAYKPKKNEVVVGEDFVNNIATIETSITPFEVSEENPFNQQLFKQTVDNSNPAIELETIINYFGFIPFDFKSLLSKTVLDSLKENDELVLLEKITVRKDKNGNKYWSVEEIDGKRHYYFPYGRKPVDELDQMLRKHLSIAILNTEVNDKGFSNIHKIVYVDNLYLLYASSLK